MAGAPKGMRRFLILSYYRFVHSGCAQGYAEISHAEDEFRFVFQVGPGVYGGFITFRSKTSYG